MTRRGRGSVIRCLPDEPVVPEFSRGELRFAAEAMLEHIAGEWVPGTVLLRAVDTLREVAG